MTTISSLPRVSSLSDQTLFVVTENGVSKVVTWAYIRTTSVGYIGSKGTAGDQGLLGYVGSKGAGYVGSQGPLGPRGPAGGFTGSGGYLGFVGSTGSGFVGSRGSAGYIGSIGNSGFDGSIGSIGFAGSQGLGFAGSQGPQGDPGGYTGSSGTSYIGSQGLPGSPGGYTGSGGQGGTGYSGSAGNGFVGSGGLGYSGSRGFSGSVGPKGESSFTFSAATPSSPTIGDRWLDSDSGRELVYFNDGDTAQWIEVAAGRVGFIGSKGEAGIPGGYSGSRGATGFGGLGYSGSAGGGYTGSSGAFAAIGYSGSAGNAGSLGFVGSQGAGFTGSGGQGFVGSSGLGYTGSLGSSGLRGFSGSQGSGFAGSQGASGDLGYTGSQGAGFTGSLGSQGTSGFVGSRGTLGFQGSRGTDGYFGSNGTLGFTGSGGTPGSSGTIGFVGSQGTAGLAWTYNVKNYGAKGNGSAVTADMTAETAAIQSAINAAQSSGGTVFFPAGTYRINSTLNITTNDQDPAARPHLLGEGAGGSAIVQTAAANGISITGNTSVPGTYVTVQGLTLIGNQVGAGLSFADSAFAHVSDVHITNWSTGIYGIDVLSMMFEKVIIRFNTNGFRFERGSGAFTSNPNAITMIGCVVGNNTTYGGWVIGAGTFNYIGGSIESNATGTGENSTNWGLRITDPGGDNVSESSVGFSLQGVYFEANGGKSNFWVEATEVNTGVVGAITGCSFNRISSSYATNHIRCEASASSYGFPIAVVGCGFRGLDGYTASVIRPNIFNGSNFFAINTISCKASSTTDAYSIPIPVTTNSTGTPGMITSDNSYMYICAADNRWYRYALATF